MRPRPARAIDLHIGIPLGAAGIAVAGILAFSLHAAATANPATFDDVSAALNVRFSYRNSPTSNKYLIETMGGGVALFDYDNDGRLDIFLTNGAAGSNLRRAPRQKRSQILESPLPSEQRRNVHRRD